ncbi:STAS domain-containing protein [Streptomyces sp. CA-251247]|uniref:STAS domain-containing protein n=1 Tax=Streptomyces sp. CA-251247 TaxID=3240062 RepID=UPI003D940E41
MTAEHPVAPQAAPGITVYAADHQRAELVLAGEISIEALPELETILDAPPLSEASAWLVDMHAVTRFDLASAYALIRAITSRREPRQSPSTARRGWFSGPFGTPASTRSPP